ncbi:MAG TPA: hypothetical protein VJ695_01860 [Nitrososphaera sp.]|nr:hypothetical protein [Nitrososphaera sp.]
MSKNTEYQDLEQERETCISARLQRTSIVSIDDNSNYGEPVCGKLDASNAREMLRKM